ncbi:hypothetical protein WA158_006546 [Blastocystis sp. Blastoise]
MPLIREDILNKQKRSELYAKALATKKKEQKKRRQQREEERKTLGDAAPPKPVPTTQEDHREYDDTVVLKNDDEVYGDEAQDEFECYYNHSKVPKVMITTRPRPSRQLFFFLSELQSLIPNSFVYKRGEFHVREICDMAASKGFTHLIVVNETNKKVHSLLLCHLPEGPTALFKISSFIPHEDISNVGAVTNHQPELILNNFTTRLGRRVGRMLGSLFPHDPQFEGRRVITFHNQRDFIFVRQHRYMFESREKGRLQELGPRFTLKPRWIQVGKFNMKGEYEWKFNHKMIETSRRKWFL